MENTVENLVNRIISNGKKYILNYSFAAYHHGGSSQHQHDLTKGDFFTIKRKSSTDTIMLSRGKKGDSNDGEEIELEGDAIPEPICDGTGKVYGVHVKFCQTKETNDDHKHLYHFYIYGDKPGERVFNFFIEPVSDKSEHDIPESHSTGGGGGRD